MYKYVYIGVYIRDGLASHSPTSDALIVSLRFIPAGDSNTGFQLLMESWNTIARGLMQPPFLCCTNHENLVESLMRILMLALVFL